MMEEEAADVYQNRLNITKKHLDILIQYMERYPRLALATARNREAHIQSRHMWEKIARTLNKIDPNVKKTGLGWKKYWVGRKFKARKRYATICQCASDGISCPVFLDTFDKKIVDIITDDEGNLLPISSVCERIYQYSDTGGETLHSKEQGSDKGCDEAEGVQGPEERLADPGVKKEDPLRVESVSYTDTKRKIKTRTDAKGITESNSEPKWRTEEMRRRILEFELLKQRELFKIEKKQMRERHKIEMEVLELKKQLLMRDLNNL